MADLIPDEIVDAVVVDPRQTGTFRGIGEVRAPQSLNALEQLLTALQWRNVLAAAEGVRDRQGVGMDEGGFRYPTDELDPGEEPLPGVEVHTSMEQVFIGQEAFERLMARFFGALIEGAANAEHPVRQQAWWPAFATIAAEIECLAAGRRSASTEGSANCP